jgi:hypothetical protein
VETIVAIAALLLAGVGLFIAVRLRAEVQQTRQALQGALDGAGEARERAAEAEQRIDRLRADLQQLGEGLKSLQAAAESPLPLKLPRARSGRLDDLREQLRAAQQEESDESEEP